jgi:RHS repeat-associated protein
MPHDMMSPEFSTGGSDEGISPGSDKKGSGLLAAFRAAKQQIASAAKHVGSKPVLAAMLIAGSALCAPRAVAQCYDFASTNNASMSPDITNLPAPVITSDGLGGTKYTYTLSGLSGNSIALTVGSNDYSLPSPVQDFVITVDNNPKYEETSVIVNLSGTTSTGVTAAGLVTLADSGSAILPNGWPTTSFPPISSWNFTKTINGSVNDVVYGPFTLTSITDCAPPPPDPKTLGGGCGCDATDPVPDNTGQIDIGDPINPGTGNVIESVTDYTTVGQNPLAFVRSYNSMQQALNPNTQATTLGINWRSNYDRYLNIVSSTQITAERADGQVLTFNLVSGVWTPDTDVDMTLTQSGTTYTLTDHNQTVEVYTASSTLATLNTITLRNGYEQTLNRTSGQLTSVTDSYNRSLGFTYYNNGMLETVTTPDTLVLTYGFTAETGGNQLTTVSYNTSPVTGLTYQYTNPSFPFALTGVLDENNNLYKSWTYNSGGQGQTSQLGNGTSTADATTVTYNTNGTTTVTNAFGVADTYTFTTLQNVPKVTNISRAASSTTLAATETFGYDTNGYLNSKTDWNGNQTTYTNDTHGDPTVINYATNSASVTYTVKIQYETPTFPQLPQIITAPGVTSTYNRDGNGNPLSRTDVDTTSTTVPYSTNGESRETQWTWSSTGQMESVQLPRTDKVAKTEFTYSGGTLTEIKDALGHETKITHSTGGGLPLTIIDPNKVTTTNTYDARLNLHTSTLSTTAGPLTTTWTYNAVNELQNLQQPDGSQLTYGYDTAHRLTSITDLLGNATTYTLDGLGGATATNVTNSSNTVTKTSSAVFDALDRMTSYIGGEGQTTIYGYDPMSNLTSITPPAPQGVISQTFDALNRLSTHVDPAPGGTTTTMYNSFNFPLTVQDANGNTTSYVYDGFNDRIQTVSPDSRSTVLYYNGDRDITKLTQPGGITKNYTYDALDRTLTAKYTGDTTLNVSNTYDQTTGHGFGVGRLTSATDQVGSLSLTYDERGNITNEVRTPTGLSALNTSTRFDGASNVSSITYPSGNLVTNIRDSMGRVTSITSQPSGATSATTIVSGVTYDPLPEFASQGAPPVTGLTFGNGMTGTYGYDLDYRPTTRVDAGTASIQNLTYGYYANDSIETITDAVNAANTQSLTYNAVDQLTKAVSGAGGYGTYAFTWDPVGNIKTETVNDTKTTYTLTAHTNKLVSFKTGTTTETVTTSASGNITEFKEGTTILQSLTYNKANQLASSTIGSTTASYAFDEFGKRLKEVGSVTGTSTFQYDDSQRLAPGSNLLTDTDGAGTSRVDYIYLNGRPIGTYQPSNNAFYFVSTNRLGTPSTVTDSTQTVQWSATYQPFGNTSTGASGIVQNLRLPGQEWDLESTFNHNGFRDYAATLTRYIETDPIGLAGGMNTYQYVRGNPFKYVDPAGEIDPYKGMQVFCLVTKLCIAAPTLYPDNWTPYIPPQQTQVQQCPAPELHDPGDIPEPKPTPNVPQNIPDSAPAGEGVPPILLPLLRAFPPSFIPPMVDPCAISPTFCVISGGSPEAKLIEDKPGKKNGNRVTENDRPQVALSRQKTDLTPS